MKKKKKRNRQKGRKIQIFRIFTCAADLMISVSLKLWTIDKQEDHDFDSGIITTWTAVVKRIETDIGQ